MMISDEGGIGRRALMRTGGAVVFGAVLLGVVAALAPFVPYLEKQLVSSLDFVTLLLADEEVRRGGETSLSNQGRLAIIEIAVQHIREHPVFGIGPEQLVQSYMRLAFLPLPLEELRGKGAHNELLRITTELGFVGLALYLLANLTILYRAIRLTAIMGWLEDFERLRLRLGIGLFIYGFVVNVFLSGGGLNTFFVMLPAGLLFSVPVTVPARAQRPVPPARAVRAWPGLPGSRGFE